MSVSDTSQAEIELRQKPGRVDTSLSEHLRRQIAAMHPAYFAMAMATGIVAIACHTLGLHEFAGGLSWVNILAYPALCVMLIVRVIWFPGRVVADLRDHARAPGYFTIVAATAVMGSQAALLHNQLAVAQVLWWMALVLWGACTYTIFAMLTINERKPTLDKGINGGWLVAVVATQSVCVLGCTLDGLILADRDTMLFILMCFWLGGGMLYLWIIGLIFYRYMFFRFSPQDLMPPYWINMGSVAISTLAGTLLANQAETSVLLGSMRPFILGLTVMFWATATWWIPMLLLLGIWRHRSQNVRFSYDPLYWGLVFPLGMYSVCTYRLAAVLDATFLLWIARVFVVAAASVWLLTFLGLARRVLFVILLAFRRPHLAIVVNNQTDQATIRA